MLFNSLHFLIFFPVVVLLYFSIPYRFRWILLLASSYYFYMSWKAEYAILLVISTLVAYFSALQIHKHESKVKRKFFLGLTLFTNLGLLFTFKYFNFFNEQIRLLFNHFNTPLHIPALNVLLPIGISFFTFQSLSYVIDVYVGRIQPTRHLGIFALYKSFFPQLVAGPIERAGHLLPQLFEKHDLDYKRIVDGLKIMLWGFFLKIVIADRLALLVDKVYNDVLSYTGPSLIAATYFFAFQVYCDFAGYSIIAIGTAKILGFDLVDNFRRPFFSKNIAEFWRRWHISLSSWFRDYAFTPFYMYIKKKKCLANLPITTQHNISFFISTIITVTLLGLWHGAHWKFILFGMYHGSLVPLYHLTKNYWDKMNKYVQIFLTFHMVVFSFIIFRANSMSDLIYIITHIFTNMGQTFSYFYHLNIGKAVVGDFLGLETPDELLIVGGFILAILFIELLQEKIQIIEFLRTRPTLRWAGYLIITLGILLFGIFDKTPFIYFQF